MPGCLASVAAIICVVVSTIGLQDRYVTVLPADAVPPAAASPISAAPAISPRRNPLPVLVVILVSLVFSRPGRARPRRVSLEGRRRQVGDVLSRQRLHPAQRL